MCSDKRPEQSASSSIDLNHLISAWTCLKFNFSGMYTIQTQNRRTSSKYTIQTGKKGMYITRWLRHWYVQAYIQQFYSIFFVLDTLKSIYSTRPRFASVEATSKSPMKKRILSRIPLQDSSSCDPPLLTSLFEFRVELLPFLCLLEPRYRWISPWWTR